MPYFLYLILGFFPALLWLAFFLHKDRHPESRKQVAKVFLWGAVATIPALAIELSIAKALELTNWPKLVVVLISVFIGVALIEEITKYLVVRWRALPNKEFDEPFDTIVYMVTAAMGFAAAENILIFVGTSQLQLSFFDLLLTSLVSRFLGGTLLHALASATVGFFVALSIMHDFTHRKWLGWGLTIATLLHGAYNLAIIELTEMGLKLAFIAVVLVALAAIVSFGLRKVKAMQLICEPD